MTLAMKYAAVLALLVLAGLPVSSGQDSPVKKVVGLLTALKRQTEVDGKAEQQSYDRYACWCERELKAKAQDISKAKLDITALLEDIKGLKAALAVHGAEIKQLEKDIAANQASQKEAEEMRAKALAEYQEQKDEMENALKALEAAITVLTGAGADKKVNRRNLRSTLQEAQLLSTAGDLRGVLQQPLVSQAVSGADFDVIKRFVAHPQDFASEHDSAFSAAQIAENPFGDYAPQSTQIQGILKSLQDSFTVSLEKLNAEEAKQVKAHAELMSTKQQEETTLTLTLNKQNDEKGSKTVTLAEKQTTLDDTREQLAADEKFFADSKASCAEKALQWSTRTRLRAEELNGMEKAIAILSSGEDIFKSATTAFLQLSSTHVHRSVSSHSDRVAAFAQLRKLASRYQSMSIAKIAVQVKSGGHFDAVIQAIDMMMKTLREEEQEDIKHRDACQNKQAANKNEMDSLNHDIETIGKTETRLNNKKGELEDQKKALADDINATKTSLAEALGMRETGNREFTKSLQDDLEAIALIEQAVQALSKFYSDNKLSIGMVQEKRQVPVPETSFQNANYGGRHSETGGIIAILLMIKEDLEKEVGTSRGVENTDQVAYWKNRKDLEESLDDQTTSKTLTEKNIADTKDLLDQADEDKTGKTTELGIQKSVEAELATDCEWVETQFDKRRQQRDAEMEGLTQAKSFLMGATA